MATEFNAFQMAQRQFDAVADKLAGMVEAGRVGVLGPEQRQHRLDNLRQGLRGGVVVEVDDVSHGIVLRPR